ncbi:uncharacterized protein LOC134158075 [Pezoporus occidentalis]|uniref:uncharacterized protein LOC134158075 n=1 Tax=Pezoporus occidentalis TaxID=407982 RepID=UPI002F917458
MGCAAPGSRRLRWAGPRGGSGRRRGRQSGDRIPTGRSRALPPPSVAARRLSAPGTARAHPGPRGATRRWAVTRYRPDAAAAGQGWTPLHGATLGAVSGAGPAACTPPPGVAASLRTAVPGVRFSVKWQSVSQCHQRHSGGPHEPNQQHELCTSNLGGEASGEWMNRNNVTLLWAQGWAWVMHRAETSLCWSPVLGAESSFFIGTFWVHHGWIDASECAQIPATCS